MLARTSLRMVSSHLVRQGEVHLLRQQLLSLAAPLCLRWIFSAYLAGQRLP